MLSQMVRRLLLPGAFIILTGFVSVLVFIGEGANFPLVFYLVAVFELILIPALFVLIIPMALLIALRAREWIWALVLAFIAVLLVALPTFVSAQLDDSRTPFAHWVRQWPSPWSDVVGTSVWHGIWLVALLVIWRFMRSRKQQELIQQAS